MTVHFKLTGARLSLCPEPPTLADGSIAVVEACFHFDDLWNGYEKTAVFRTAKGEIRMLVTDGRCPFPKEALEKSGEVLVGVFGTRADRLLTSTMCRVRIAPGTPTEGADGEIGTPGLYAQFAAKFHKFETMTASAAPGDAADAVLDLSGESAVLHLTLPRGEPGKDGKDGGVEYAAFEIEDGELYALTTDDLHTVFSLNDGHLEVTIK